MLSEKSVLQKLKSKARSEKLPYQLILRLFCQEEFLRRLAHSEYREKLILKGGLFLFSYSGFESRPTMDIDFLAQALSNDAEEMKKVINHIIQIRTDYDYIAFELKNVENIAEVKAYHGVRLKMLACIANTKTPFDIDIGIGDVVVPDVQTVEIPTQLKDFESPVVSSYSLESTIAEKLEAMFDRMEASSRMKDYYDIYFLSSNYTFNNHILAEAIKKTFEKRETVCDLASLERIGQMHLNSDMARRWEAFTRKSLGITLDFAAVTRQIKDFIETPMRIINGDENSQLLL